ncbi:MAG TPA: ROK family protein [Dehalococcoidia bacterium]|nr:ROK family protein [Dehalococcoidia bacterium]
MALKIEQQNPVLALDIGGTVIRLALVSMEGKILARKRLPTMAGEGPAPVINRMFSAMKGLLQSHKLDLSQLHSISIATAGVIDTDNGIITSSPNLPGWIDIPLRDTVETAYKTSTFLLNDANAAALGEHRFGAGKGSANLFYITVSTGIGGGVIIDNKLYSGTSGGAGEIGHMTIDVNGPACKCGSNGCLETLASGTAVAREAITRIRNGEKSSLAENRDSIENITAKDVGQAAREGDPLALAVISRAAFYLGVGLANLVNLLNPEIIIVGGGLSKLGNLLLEPAREVVQERAFRLPAQAARIVLSRLGDDAGILGAAVFAHQAKK